VWALMGDGTIGMLPGGVDQYLELRSFETVAAQPPQEPRRTVAAQLPQEPSSSPVAVAAAAKAKVGGAEERAARKTVARIDKQLARLTERESELSAAMAAIVDDYEEMGRLATELQAVAGERAQLEEEWLEAAALLE